MRDLKELAALCETDCFFLPYCLPPHFLSLCGAICAQDANLPHLEKRGNTTQLIVDGKPFLMLC